MKIVVIAVVGLVLLGASIFVGMKFIGPGEGDAEHSEKKADEKTADEKTGEVAVYPMDTFIVNLDGEGGRRYLKVKMALEVENGLQKSLDDQRHKIRDTILILLSSKTYEDLKGAEGKYAMREEVKVRINKIVGKGVVKELYLEEFVVQ